MKMSVKVSSYKDCIPKKGVWYEYAGTIFISVMLKSKPYIRRKSRIDDNKTDNSMSEWHLNWQYGVIEINYGFEQYQIKSFEHPIIVENEKHIIDSKVENLAIEFQHTLSVDIEEINSRYNAHLNYGLTPYLVIDLTSYNYQDFKHPYYFEFKLRKKLQKWIECGYAQNNNLFLDLEDTIVRIINTPGIDSYKIEKGYFTDNLLNLEKDLSDKILINNLIQKRKQLVKLIAQRRKIVEEEKYRSKENKKQFFKQLSEQQKEEKTYIKRRNQSKDFTLFRKCFSNPVIKPLIDLYRDDIFDYYSESKNAEKNALKIHYYNSRTGNINIECVEHISETREEKPTNSGYELIKNYTTIYTEVILRKNNSIIAEFKWEKGKSPEILDNNQISLF